MNENLKHFFTFSVRFPEADNCNVFYLGAVNLGKNYTEIKSRVFLNVQNRLVRVTGLSDDEVLRIIEEEIVANPEARSLPRNKLMLMRHDLFNRIRGLDILQDFLDDDTVTEIMVNGTDEIFVERGGLIYATGKRFESRERLFDVIGQIASNVNRVINLSFPIMDSRLDDGSRVNAVLDPVAINGPSLTIRRFPNTPVDAGMLIKFGSVSDEVLNFLSNLVRAGYNILISGGTGSGKTTFLNVLSGYIPKDERIITIEDSAELRIAGIKNLVRLEARKSTPDGTGEISIRDLIKTALRMRPDRIVVGEVRGEEAIDMLQAFNVGQDGSLSTIHANSAVDALSRLETMIMLSSNISPEALRRQIASGVDIVISLGRLRDKSRKLLEIIEVMGVEDKEIKTNTLFRFVEKEERCGKIVGDIVKVNNLSNTYKLIKAGITYELR